MTTDIGLNYIINQLKTKNNWIHTDQQHQQSTEGHNVLPASVGIWKDQHMPS